MAPPKYTLFECIGKVINVISDKIQKAFPEIKLKSEKSITDFREGSVRLLSEPFLIGEGSAMGTEIVFAF